METHAIMWFALFILDSGGFLEKRLGMRELPEVGAELLCEGKVSHPGGGASGWFPPPRWVPHSSSDQETRVPASWRWHI